MKTRFATKFDQIFFFVFLVLVAMSFFATSAVKHLLLYFVPLLLLFRKVVFKDQFLQEVLFTQQKILALIVWQVSLIPVIIALANGVNVFSNQQNFQWLNYHNSWIVLFCFVLSNFFVKFSQNLNLKFKPYFYASLAFLVGCIIDFLYAVYKWSINGFAVDNRWQGSSGNPQLWAVQLSLALLVLIIVRKDLNQYFKNQKLSQALFIIITSGIILSGSLSNFIGLFFASCALCFSNSFFVLVLAFIYVISMNCFTVNYLLHGNIDIQELKQSLNVLTNKFLPRIRLWLKLIRHLPNYDYNWFWGMGLEKYNIFMDTVTHGKHQNAHSLIMHNYWVNGVSGVYMHFIALFTSAKEILKNKYFLAIFVFAVTSSVFDCAISFLEIQLVFWLVFPLIVSKFMKSL